MLLAKPKLPHDVIDTSVGEPYIVRDILMETFDLSYQEIPSGLGLWEYPDPIGYKPLVDLLEEKYGAPVIITNGAKQALGATLYALKRLGKKKVGMRTPYWALLPPLIHMHGLQMRDSFDEADANLLVMPNNPDGFVMSPEDIKTFTEECNERKLPIIHDAAYYTHIYLPDDSYPLDPIGDVQIFSISKMLGLSGLRLGYVVCHNRLYHQYIQEYMEAMTVGVSNLSQAFLYDLLMTMNDNPELSEEFERKSHQMIKKCKLLIKQVHPDVLACASADKVSGMFGWFKPGPKADFAKAKVHIIEGSPFGMSGMIRMNLALHPDKMEEVVNRLNSLL